MRQGYTRHGLNFRYLQNPEVGLPLMEPIQRIVVRAEIVRHRLLPNRLLEHPTQCQPIDDSSVNAKTDDAACELVHDHQHPIGSQSEGFTTKQVGNPQTVLHMSEKREPGRARSRLRSKILC